MNKLEIYKRVITILQPIAEAMGPEYQNQVERMHLHSAVNSLLTLDIYMRISTDEHKINRYSFLRHSFDRMCREQSTRKMGNVT